MSDDLVKRLRDRPYRIASETEAQAAERRQRDREEAADALIAKDAEIARLRAVIAAAANRIEWCAGLIEIDDARDRGFEFSEDTRGSANRSG